MSGLDTQMNFEIVRDALRATLEAGSISGGHPGRFRVPGSPKQRTGDNEILNLNRSVQIYYFSGDFENSSKQELNHDAKFEIKLNCSSDTKADLATFEDELSTSEEIQTAFAAVELATDRVEDSMDELWRMVIQILKDPKNQYFGLAKGAVSTVRMPNFVKSDIMEKGDLVTLTAKGTLSCNMDETLIGATPTILGPADQPALDIETHFTTPEDNKLPTDPTITPAKTGIDIDTTAT